jgi:hypothetical protein
VPGVGLTEAEEDRGTERGWRAGRRGRRARAGEGGGGRSTWLWESGSRVGGCG